MDAVATTNTAAVTIPGLKVRTPGNGRRVWQVEAREAKEQRAVAKLFCSQLGTAVRDAARSAPRLSVRFVRIGGRKLDPTNLVGAMKHVQDGMADWLGVDDRSDWYHWEWPTQEAGECGVRIELRW